VPVRIAVLGAGRIGRLHAEVIEHQVAGAGVSCVYDAVPAASAAVAAELGVRAAPTLDEVLGPDVDAVAICSSTDTHVAFIEAAAGSSKAIFCEKPLSLDVGRIDHALAAVARAGVPLQVGFNRRFDPSHRSVRDAVVDGTVGDVHLVRITSRDPSPPPLEYVRTSGGIFLDMTIHDFDMARFITGSEVAEVYAQGAVRIDPVIGDVGDVDTAVVVLRHENECITTIDNSRKAVYGYDQRVEAFGSHGVASSENPLAHCGVRRIASGTTLPPLPEFFVDRYYKSYVREWEAFVRYVRDGGPSPVSGADGRAPLLIGLAALRSLERHAPVEVKEIG